MELVLIGFAALLASGLTLLSGFGLGTALMPVFALFFPLPLAIAATAVVHFTNNLFKLGLMAQQADWSVVVKFSVPAAFTAILGAGSLTFFDQLPPLWHYSIAGSSFEITTVKAVIGSLIILFALLEMSTRFQTLAFPTRWLPIGGALSGFFGGLSGNQGALRSAFLLKAGLSKESFVATGVVSAVIVDAVRLAVYGSVIFVGQLSQAQTLALPVAVGAVCAFIGAFLGKRMLQKVTLRTVQLIVAGAMLGIGAGLTIGLL
ncbi:MULTISPECIES: TSUP family transporter [unclassified Pseudomonas]|uniref:TSUP family transporter n=1 Tax=unclassified Pseudomonas TaxID=196821 RepID=UPI002447A475|nr:MULTISPECIES: TSUP family transporter [unclassified Pseudomonas]MDH0894613.1 sulfite exporter TauE/SafE family protein [Pseudomonas sp. GD03875]MDH1063092.1 sulfite exporter TauE/SafE family protein [Pseudomonas sp. GD03985]